MMRRVDLQAWRDWRQLRRQRFAEQHAENARRWRRPATGQLGGQDWAAAPRTDHRTERRGGTG